MEFALTSSKMFSLKFNPQLKAIDLILALSQVHQQY